MANTDADNYIETLSTGSQIEMEIGICTITACDSHDCTVVDDEGNEYEYDWGQVAEFWEIQKAIDKEDYETNAGIDEAKQGF